jgi:uncharacterized protein
MNNFVPRILEESINKFLNRKEIIAITGVRQCGKTTLMKKIMDDLIKKGNSCNYLTLDDFRIQTLIRDDLDSFIDIHIKPFKYVFLDEIQYISESGRILKFIYDTCNVKIILTGSSATEISIQGLKHLVGRIINFTLYPFSFEEFLNVKNPAVIPVFKKGKYKNALVNQLNKLLTEFLLYGGFPEVVLTNDKTIKVKILENIYNTFMLREIRDLFELSEDYKLNKLLKALSLQTGNLLNYNELSSISGITYTKLKNYLNILSKTFIIELVIPFYTNKRTELKKNPKIYFLDPGFRNICMDSFGITALEQGAVYEQFVFNELHKTGTNMKYWRTKSGAEVDFIIEHDGPLPLEIKKNLKDPDITRSFRSFLQKYNPGEAYVLSMNFEGMINCNDTSIYFLPFVKSNQLIKSLLE